MSALARHCSIATAPIPFHDATALSSDPEALRQCALRDGYIWMRNAVPVEKVEALQARMFEAGDRLGWFAGNIAPTRARPGLRLGAHDDSRYHTFLADILTTREIDALRNDENILRLVSALCGGSVVPLGADICRVFSPDSEAFTTLPHQDGQYLGIETEFWVAWIPVVDCPTELGPLAVLPGSHSQGLMTHTGTADVKFVSGVKEDAAWTSGDLAVGDIVIFHGLTLHAALPNKSDKWFRLSVDFRYRPAA